MISEQSLTPLWHRGGRAGNKHHGEQQDTPVFHLTFPFLSEANRARRGKYLRRCARGQATIRNAVHRPETFALGDGATSESAARPKSAKLT